MENILFDLKARINKLKQNYKIGDHVYIVENGLYVKEVVIVGISGCFYQICYTDKQGSIRLRESKLYRTKEEAESQWSAHKQAHTQAQERKGFRSPYAFMMH